jgi:hypothetical protein
VFLAVAVVVVDELFEVSALVNGTDHLVQVVVGERLGAEESGPGEAVAVKVMGVPVSSRDLI